MAKIFIVGGGVSGLSAGIYGALSGHEVTIAERHSTSGGNLTGWRREGFTIDNCIHWLTGTNPATKAYKTWVELGALGGVEIVKCDTLYTYSYGGRSLSLCRDLSRLEKKMLEISPADRGEILSLMRAVRTIQGYSGIGGAKHNRGVRTRELLPSIPALLRYYRGSCKDLSERFKSPLLSGFIRSFFGDCFGAIALIFVFAHFTGENADLPRGGSIAMAERMTNRFLSLGGELLLKSPVVKINHKCGKASSAILADGREIFADYFVFACDPKPNYEKLLSLPLPRALEKLYRRSDMRRFSSYHAAFTIDGDAPFNGDYIFPLPDRRCVKLLADHLVLREFSHEESFSPKGKSIIQVMAFIPESTSRSFIKERKMHPNAYEARKGRMAEEIKASIEEQLPALSGKLSLLDFWTPATYERYTGAEVGAYMGFALPKKYIPRVCPSKIPELRNVYLATQWQLVPGGLPTAADLGRKVIKEIVAAEKRGERSPSPRKRFRRRPLAQS